MKIIYILTMLLLTATISHAQLATDSWALGFGYKYPRYLSANITALNSNYGGYVSLQRTFSEHFALRLKGGYAHIEGEWTDQASNIITQSTNLITGDLDFMYYLIPCEPVSPYLYAGIGGNYRMLTNKATPSIEDNAIGSQYNIGGGVEWSLGGNWKFVSEFGYHSTGNSELDGVVNVTELNARDSYWDISLGFNFLFGKGEPSPMCEIHPIGMEMKDMTDYNKIEDMIKKHIPKEVVKEVIREVPIEKNHVGSNWVLFGVNFDFDKSTLLPQSYPILQHAFDVLKNNPKLKVEIRGYTDNIGNENYNIKLSNSRAITVKDYLVKRGIESSRLTTAGFGEANPVADNNTAEGRAMNRRIEFIVIE
jgi:OmpA-OmpF porin, OOP family